MMVFGPPIPSKERGDKISARVELELQTKAYAKAYRELLKSNPSLGEKTCTD